MTIVVTGATGQFGKLAIAALQRRGIPAADIVAVGRDPEKLARLDVPTRVADYGDPDALRAAFAGGDRLLFVSGSELGERIAQHRNVVDAAEATGFALVAYTSIPHAHKSDLILAREHFETEQMIIEAGLPYAFLRNSWYYENYLPTLGTALEHGLIDARIFVALVVMALVTSLLSGPVMQRLLMQRVLPAQVQ